MCTCYHLTQHPCICSSSSCTHADHTLPLLDTLAHTGWVPQSILMCTLPAHKPTASIDMCSIYFCPLAAYRFIRICIYVRRCDNQSQAHVASKNAGGFCGPYPRSFNAAPLMPHAKILLGLQVPVRPSTESNRDKRNASQQLFATQNWQAAAE